MAIVCAVICAIVYGASDFCGGIASRRSATLGVVVVTQAVGFVLVLALMPWFGGTPDAADAFWGAMCGVAAAVALVLLYRGLAIGTMGVVSPVAAVLAAVVPIAYGVGLRGERPSWLALLGIVVALGAVVCVSLAPDRTSPVASVPARHGLPPGVLEAIGAGVGFGAIFITLAQTRPEAAFSPLLVARLTTIVVLAAIAIAGRNAGDLRLARPAVAAAIVCGVLDVSANALYLIAVRQGAISIVAVITSLYPASTLTLAAVVFRERLVRAQWAGVVMALAGVAAISAAR